MSLSNLAKQRPNNSSSIGEGNELLRQQQHPHPLRSHCSSEDIMAPRYQDQVKQSPLIISRTSSSYYRRGSLHSSGTSRRSSDIIPPVPQIPSKIHTISSGQEGFGHSASSRTTTSDFPVIPVRPPLRPTLSSGGLSTTSSFSQSSIPEKAFGMSVEEDFQDRRPISRRYDWRFYCAFACLCILNFTCHVSTTTLCTILPTLSQDFSLTAVQTLWIPGSLLLSAVTTQPLFMRLCHALGCKSLLLFALVVYIGGNITSALARQATVHFLGQALQGIGVGAISVLTQLSLAQISPNKDFDRPFNRTLERSASHLFWLGLALGPLIGGAINEAIGWRSIFWAQLHLGIIGLVMTAALLRLPTIESTKIRSRLFKVDLLGWLLLAGTMISTTIGISHAGTTHRWTSWHTFLPLSFGLLGFIGLCLYNMYRIDPILPISILRNKSALVSCACAVIHGGVFAAIVYLMPNFFQLRDVSTTMTGLSLSAWTCSLFVSALIASFLVGRIGYRWPLCIGWALTTNGIGLTILFKGTTPGAVWIVIAITTGLGLGLLSPSLPTSIDSCASNDDETIHAAALATFFATLGQTGGILLGGSLFLNGLKHNLLHTASLSDNALQYASDAFSFINVIAEMSSEKAVLQMNLTSSYMDSLRYIWIAACALVGVVFLLSVVFTEDRRPERKRPELE